MTQPELSPYYYLHNFRLLVDWVHERYGDLLGDEAQVFVRNFNQLQRNAQCLLVRLISRKGPWFRADKLKYAEIEKLTQAADQLIAYGLLHIDCPMALDELAAQLTKPELLQLFGEQLKAQKSQRKEILIAQLSTEFSQPQSWQHWTQNQFGQAYKIETQNILSTLLLLFFGNPYQDLTEFVLQDLGLYTYEKYEIDPQHRLFASREELLQYQQLLVLRELLAEAEDVDFLQLLIPQIPAPFANAKMERRRAKFINDLAYECEMYGETELAFQLYQQSDLPPARERKIRLLEKRGDYQQAWQLLNAVMASPFNEHELQIAERMAPRLAKKISITFSKKSALPLTEQQLVLPRLNDDDGNFFDVEEIARQYFDTDNAPCFYAENALLNSLFGLWLWPEMFRSVQGAFTNPFQTAPLDLYQDDFQLNRPDLDRLWKMFDENLHQDHITSVWQEKQGLANHFVHWDFMDGDILQMALECIPAQHLKLIFKRLLFDLKANRSGLPDLIQFFPQTKTYRMIEVKGPGDRLQDNQLRWLAFFAQHQIPAEVCYVSWQQDVNE